MDYLAFFGVCVVFLISFSTSGSNKTNNRDDALRIVFGAHVRVSDVPYAVYVADMTIRKACSGGIIHVQWVLSAAHCFGKKWTNQKHDVHILAGIDDFDRDQNEQKREVITLIRHPKYAKDPTPQYDAALLKLESPLKLNKYVKIIPLAGKPWRIEERYSRKCVAAGWGKVSSTNTSKLLRRAFVVARHGASGCPCNSKKGNKNVVCLKSRGVICSGDSGGLLACKGEAVAITAAIYEAELCRLRKLPKDYDPHNTKCEVAVSIMMFICPKLDWISSFVPKVPKKPKSCRSADKTGASFYDTWDSASKRSSTGLFLISLSLFFVK